MIDKATIEHVAKLARLKLTDDEVMEFSTQLQQVLSHFEHIKNVDTQGVEPLVTPIEIDNFLREDIEQKQFTPEEILSNAPDRSGNLFKVPPVV
jgi:aspartyl-tRNA(Asn)/glutamyl-tRNA(Gln) amidotransferase subunit C